MTRIFYDGLEAQARLALEISGGGLIARQTLLGPGLCGGHLLQRS